MIAFFSFLHAVPECPPNSQYQECGTACPATCLDDQTQQQLLCPAVCVAGCHCLPGFVLSQGKCIPKSSCGCQHEGYLYAPNEAFWADDKCTKRCVCNPATNQIECTLQACKSSEKCLVVKGVRDCYPIDFVSCQVHGDPHYISFDKYKFDFQGPCAYVLTEVCEKPMDLNWFGVYVQNEYRGNRAVSWTRSVQINVYGIEIIISRQYPGKVLVSLGSIWLLQLSSLFDAHFINRVLQRIDEASKINPAYHFYLSTKPKRIISGYRSDST